MKLHFIDKFPIKFQRLIYFGDAEVMWKNEKTCSNSANI